MDSICVRMVSPLFGGVCGGGVGVSTSEAVRLQQHCVSPHVRPQVAGLVEALPTLHADEVSLVGLRPERPSALEHRAAGAPALVKGSQVLRDVCLEDAEEVQALLGALRCRLLLDGVRGGWALRGCGPSGAGLGGGLPGR